VFQYSLSVSPLTTELAERLFLSTGVNTILYENISRRSDEQQQLPHVRSDFGEYAKGPRESRSPVLNRVFSPRAHLREAQRGWLEQMYGGVAGSGCTWSAARLGRST